VSLGGRAEEIVGSARYSKRKLSVNGVKTIPTLGSAPFAVRFVKHSRHELPHDGKLSLALQTIERTNILRCSIMFEQWGPVFSRNGPIPPFGCIEYLHADVVELGVREWRHFKALPSEGRVAESKEDT